MMPVFRQSEFIVLYFCFLLLPLGGFTQDTLVVGYELSSPPFVFIQNEQLHGPSVWLWQQIAEEQNLQYEWVHLPLDSLLVSIERGQVDISGSPLTITSERLETFDFSPPYYIAHSAILIKDVAPTQRLLEFLASFLSLNFFRALGALAVVIFIFGMLEWFFERKANDNQFGKGLDGLAAGFWWSAVTMTTVGYGDKAPKTAGGRIVAFVWMFTAIIIISGFTASIASSLTVNRIGAEKHHIQDFKEKRLGTIHDSATDRWLRDNFYTNKHTYSKMPELITALETGKIDAIAYDRPILQDIVNKDSLNRFRVLDIHYNPQFYAIGMNRRMPAALKQRISLSVLEHSEVMDWRVLLSEFDLEYSN